MKRDFFNELLKWRDSSRRKPLLVTGVRQCGKTHTLKEFGCSCFDNVCYINLESSSNYAAIFDYDFDVRRIIREIELMEQCTITAGKTQVYMSDIGLLCRRLGLGYRDFLDETGTMKTFKGAVVENFVMNELKCYGRNPYFWRSGNTAELDFMYEENGEIVPVEVKSADNTQAKSYRQFCKKYKPRRGYKLSLKNLAVNDCEGTTTTSLPLYLTWKKRI